MIVGLQARMTLPRDATCALVPAPSVENEATLSALKKLTPKK
jgi:hypothetical protein